MAVLSKSSTARVKAFVDDFIRSEDVEMLTSERDSDFINEPNRAARCYDAAENGSDGKTHSDVIQDWRDAFGYWLHARGRGKWSTVDRFEAAVGAHFDSIEKWHEANGSLWKEVG